MKINDFFINKKNTTFNFKIINMKNRRNLFFILMLVLIGLGAVFFLKKTPKTTINEQSILGTSSAPTLTDLQSQIVEGFNSKDAQALAQLCDEEIQFTHGETDDFFTKENVQSYLKEFFIALPTKKFSVVHSGNNKGATGYYLIGDLQTTNGKKMRVQISNNKKTIQSIEINDHKDF